MFIESMHFADGDADVLFEAVVLLHIAEALAWLALCVVHGVAAFAGGVALFAVRAGAVRGGGGRREKIRPGVGEAHDRSEIARLVGEAHPRRKEPARAHVYEIR